MAACRACAPNRELQRGTWPVEIQHQNFECFFSMPIFLHSKLGMHHQYMLACMYRGNTTNHHCVSKATLLRLPESVNKQTNKQTNIHVVCVWPRCVSRGFTKHAGTEPSMWPDRDPARKIWSTTTPQKMETKTWCDRGAGAPFFR